jgi:hypothetical protein
MAWQRPWPWRESHEAYQEERGRLPAILPAGNVQVEFLFVRDLWLQLLFLARVSFQA